jgi:hypothetical protein
LVYDRKNIGEDSGRVPNLILCEGKAFREWSSPKRRLLMVTPYSVTASGR